MVRLSREDNHSYLHRFTISSSFEPGVYTTKIYTQKTKLFTKKELPTEINLIKVDIIRKYSVQTQNQKYFQSCKQFDKNIRKYFL